MEEFDVGTDVMDRDEIDFEEPRDCCLIGLNDDYTTTDFVIGVLRNTCHRSEAEAQEIMVSIHKKGSGVMWKGTYDLAQTKALQITALAKKMGYPFKTIVEEA
jgi:ATP-dependent Clp protease adaptor protein ClpS